MILIPSAAIALTVVVAAVVQLIKVPHLHDWNALKKDALAKVLQLRGVTFTKDDKRSIGVIAQEIEKVIPEVVSTAEYKSVAYGNLVGLLIEAIKELKIEIDQLKENK